MDVWSDKKRQNQERTHPRNDESSAGVQKDNGEKTEMVWARHEDGRRSRSEESDDESDTGEKEERETKGSFHVKSSGHFHGPSPILLKFCTLVGIV